MALKHAVLGLVIERPSYGYELTRRLVERCPNRGWERSNVYVALTALQKKGQIRSIGETARGDSGRAVLRRMYETTPAGLAFFDKWLRERVTPLIPARQELDLKIRFASAELLPNLIEQTRNQETECLNLLQNLISLPGPSGPIATLGEASALLDRNGAIKALQIRVEWLQEVRRTLQAILDRRAQ